MKLKVGCCGFTLPQDEYLTELSVVELATPLKPATARKWRERAPAPFEFVVPVPFAGAAAARAAWPAARALADALAAQVVLLQSPPAFTPTAAHRAELERFLAEIDRGGQRFAWEPSGGLWEPRDIAAVCRAAEVVHGTDPLQARPVTQADWAYFRLQGGATRGQHSDTELEKLLLACEGWGEVYVVFGNVGALASARRFTEIVKELT
jgi:uncharacterized protein YecE (DUF72 family)